MNGKPANAVAYRYTLFAICFLGGVFGGITSALMSAYLPDVAKDLTGNATEEHIEKVSSIINAASLFGMTLGGLLLGFFCDRAGRKIAIQVSLLFLGLFTLLTSFVNNWWVVVALRFLTGFGVSGILVTGTILVAEEWTSKKRNIALGILSITIPVGIFSAGLITYNISSWRTGFLAGLVPIIIAIIAQFTVHESETWKQDRLLRQQQKAAAKPSIFASATAYDLLYGSIIYGAMLIGLWAIFLWLPTWVQTILKNSDGQEERGTSMMLFAIGGLSGGFISGWVSNLLGMKRTMLICFAATFILALSLFRFTNSLTVITYAQMALIALFFGISQGVLNAYIPALFPVSIRSAATGFCFNIGRLFTASAVFFLGWLVQFLGGYGNSLTAFSFIFLLGFLVTLTVKEKPLLQ